MKRLAWILIALVCTTLAQVQPVDLPVAKDPGCCCCDDQAGACGMPDCAPAPAACPSAVALPIAASQNAAARKPAPTPPARHQVFPIRFESRPAPKPALSASRRGAPAAAVPLFKAHCSFVI